MYLLMLIHKIDVIEVRLFKTAAARFVSRTKTLRLLPFHFLCLTRHLECKETSGYGYEAKTFKQNLPHLKLQTFDPFATFLGTHFK